MAWQFAPGEILTATNLNAVTVPWNAICQVSMSTTQSISNNSTTTILFDTEDLDPRGWHSTVSLTGRITPTIAGWYEAFGIGSWGSDNDYTRRLIDVAKNGSGITNPERRFDPGPNTAVGGTQVGPVYSGLVSMNGSSDYFEMIAFQTNTSTGANTIRALFKVQLVYPT